MSSKSNAITKGNKIVQEKILYMRSEDVITSALHAFLSICAFFKRFSSTDTIFDILRWFDYYLTLSYEILKIFLRINFFI